MSEMQTVTPMFFAFLAQVTHYLPAEKILKNSIDWKIFVQTSLSDNLLAVNHDATFFYFFIHNSDESFYFMMTRK